MKIDFETYKLGAKEHANPILYQSLESDLQLPNLKSEQLQAIFPHSRHQLKTWGNTSTSGCHYIAVQKQTPLHTDKGFPKYTHHLILHCDDFVLRGLDKAEMPIPKGLYFVLDGHSPHQLLAKSKAARHYVAVSYDSHKIEDKTEVITKMLAYLSSVCITDNLDGKNL